ncbi:MAG: hypothetical protein M1823_009085, partial [Watsoniomyces obsoletus]
HVDDVGNLVPGDPRQARRHSEPAAAVVVPRQQGPVAWLVCRSMQQVCSSYEEAVGVGRRHCE